jgi:hypothetical protein
MKFLNFLMEYKTEYGYAGRDVVTGTNPIIWMFLNKPSLGLIWSDTDGNVYHFDKRISKIDDYSPKATHKTLLSAAYEKLGLKGNLRQDVDDIVDNYMDKNVRGRVVKDTIYLYSGFNKKLSDKAIQSVYDYIPEKK